MPTQLSFFESNTRFVFNKPIRVIELFAGIGSQTQALKNIGVPHKVVAISEIDKYAIQSYEAIHGKVNNLGDIREIKELPSADLWTYSFPCQDISVAGKGAGIKEGTRSGLLFEVERLLRVAEENGTLPKYLLLENVKNLVSKKFRTDFDSWLLFLSGIGYTNYWKVLNAKDYGIPQNRERVFCVSIRGEHMPFVFPNTQELKLRLRDLIDKEVDERYYLKESTIKSIITSHFNSRRDSIRPSDGLANTLCARDWRGPQCVQVGEVVGGKWEKMHDISKRVYDPDGLAPTVHCQQGGNTELKIAEDFVLGGLQKHQTPRTDGISPTLTGQCHSASGSSAMLKVELEDVKVLAPNNWNHQAGDGTKTRERIEKEIVPALQATAGQTQQSFLKIKVATKKGYEEAKPGDYVNITYPGSQTKRGRVGEGVAHTLTCGDGNAVITENVRIRKLTPRECLRLMGWKDEQIDKIQNAKISSTQQYRQAGNGIVVDVLMEIFKNLLQV